jgi:hypothetical protein
MCTPQAPLNIPDWTSSDREAVRRLARELRISSSHRRDVWLRWRLTWKQLRDVPRDQRWLPLCSTCHRFRDCQGEWQELPPGMSGHLRLDGPLQVTHGICPDCDAMVQVGDEPASDG